MRRVLAVLGRELRAAFESSVARVTLALFVPVLAGLYYFAGQPLERVPLPGLWEGGEASLAAAFAWLPLLLALVVPALTMGAWSQERRAGTEALIFSWPVRPIELVLGKLLAVWALLTLVLFGTLVPLALGVAALGPLDPGVAAAGTAGAVLLAGSQAALALWVASTTDEPLVAYLLGALLLVGLWAARLAAFALPGWAAPLVQELSPATHYLEGAARGVLDLSDLLRLVGLLLLGVLLNTAVLGRRTLGPAPAAGPARRRRRDGRRNAVLHALLLVAIAVEAGVLVGRHVHLRRDLSEEGLHELSPATRSILGRVDGTLQIKAFFSGRVESGAMQLAKARVETWLDELVRAGGGRLRLDVVDPTSRADLMVEAEQYGIRPRLVESRVGTLARSEDVYLGLVLRYRAREAVLPFVTPADLEVQIATRVEALLRERAPVVGWHVGRAGRSAARFESAAALLRAQGHELRELRVAEDWDAPSDLLVLVAPRELGEAELEALERHVLAGGPALLCLDEVHVDGSGRAEPAATGLDPLLRALGVSLFDHHVWDDPWSSVLYDWSEGRRPRPVAYPLAPAVRPEGFAAEVPATAGLQRARFVWAQPVEAVREALEGERRTVLLRSSPDAYPVDLIAGPLVLDPDAIAARTAIQYAGGRGRSLPLAVLLEGRLAGRDGRRGTEPARVVVVGDSDWLRDPGPGAMLQPFLEADNQRLLLNLVDWLVLEDPDLVALRARRPRDRSLRDLEAEERRRLGLRALEPGAGVAALDHERELEARARRSASLRRWRAMLLPTGAALVLVFGLTALWTRHERRRPGPGRKAGGPAEEARA